MFFVKNLIQRAFTKTSVAFVNQAFYIKNVNTALAPKAIGPYVQGKIVPSGSDLFYSSGQIPLDPNTMQIVSEKIEDQTEQVMKNLAAVLAEAKTGFDNVIKTTIFLQDMGDFGKVNEIYAKYFPGDNKPARSCVAVRTLPKNVKVEIELIAFVPQ